MTRRRTITAATALALLLLLACTLATITQVHAAAAAAADTEIEVDVASPAAAAAGSAAAAVAPSSLLPEFVPTAEWAEVAEGQAIPPGLWVRMDLSSGKKMARLLPEEEKNDAARRLDASRRASAANELALVPETDAPATEDNGPLIRELPLPGEGTVPSSVDSSEESLDALMSARAQRLALLKSHFYLKEDVEMMKQLLALCIDASSSADQVMNALESLEEYLHQIDNARDWTKIGGLDVSLTLLQQQVTEEEAAQTPVPVAGSDASDFNSTGASAVPAPLDLQRYRLMSLQAHAAWVLGTAAQNNLEVQEAARKEGAVSIVAALFRRTMNEAQQDKQSQQQQRETPSADTTAVSLFQLRSSRLKLLSKLLYALSALLRNNARTQSIFQRSGAVALLKQEIDEDWPRCPADAESSGAAVSPLHCLSPPEFSALWKLAATARLKSLNLLHDFILDHTLNSQEVRSPLTGATVAANKDASDPALFAELTGHEWCEHFLARAVRPEGGAAEAAAAAAGAAGAAAGDAVAPSPSVLHTREQALEILSALFSHDAGLCVHALSVPASAASRAEQQLRAVEQQHALWAKQAEAEAGADADGDADAGKARYHDELREAAASIRAKITNAADAVQAVPVAHAQA